MRVQNISWREHKNAEIYGDISPISSIVACRRTCFAGYCFRAKNHKYDFLETALPNQRKKTTDCIDCIARDIGHVIADRQTLMSDMSDRDTWRGIVYTLSRMRPPGSSRYVIKQRGREVRKSGGPINDAKQF